MNKQSKLWEYLTFLKKSENEQYLTNILGVSEVTLEHFNETCKTTDRKGLFEVFMFNVFFCWTYYNERELLKPNNKIIQKKILYLYDKAKYFDININQPDFIKLYQARFAAFDKEFQLFNKSDYPNTKQYLPAYIFSVLYYEQLKMHPDLSDLTKAPRQNDINQNSKGLDKYYELATFTGDFQQYLNTIIEILKNYNNK